MTCISLSSNLLLAAKSHIRSGGFTTLHLFASHWRANNSLPLVGGQGLCPRAAFRLARAPSPLVGGCPGAARGCPGSILAARKLAKAPPQGWEGETVSDVAMKQVLRIY